MNHQQESIEYDTPTLLGIVPRINDSVEDQPKPRESDRGRVTVSASVSEHSILDKVNQVSIPAAGAGTAAATVSSVAMPGSGLTASFMSMPIHDDQILYHGVEIQSDLGFLSSSESDPASIQFDSPYALTSMSAKENAPSLVSTLKPSAMFVDTTHSSSVLSPSVLPEFNGNLDFASGSARTAGAVAAGSIAARAASAVPAQAQAQAPTPTPTPAQVQAQAPTAESMVVGSGVKSLHEIFIDGAAVLLNTLTLNGQDRTLSADFRAAATLNMSLNQLHPREQQCHTPAAAATVAAAASESDDPWSRVPEKVGLSRKRPPPSDTQLLYDNSYMDAAQHFHSNMKVSYSNARAPTARCRPTKVPRCARRLFEAGPAAHSAAHSAADRTTHHATFESSAPVDASAGQAADVTMIADVEEKRMVSGGYQPHSAAAAATAASESATMAVSNQRPRPGSEYDLPYSAIAPPVSNNSNTTSSIPLHRATSVSRRPKPFTTKDNTAAGPGATAKGTVAGRRRILATEITPEKSACQLGRAKSDSSFGRTLFTARTRSRPRNRTNGPTASLSSSLEVALIAAAANASGASAGPGASTSASASASAAARTAAALPRIITSPASAPL
jgi:hypothetical protein